MILIEPPCCDEPMAIDSPMPTTLRCEACSVAWSIVDPGPEPAAPAA
jgi:hypothetical protein